MGDVGQAPSADAGMEAAIQRIVHLARTCMGMDMACVSRLREGHLVIETISGALPGTPDLAGLSFDVPHSYCARALRGDNSAVIPDTRVDAGARALPVTSALGIGSYLGAALRSADGQLYGTLCLVSRSPRPGLHERDLDVLAPLVGLIEQAIDDRARFLTVRADRIARIRRVLDAGGPAMVYQPIHSLPELRVVGYEALSRFPSDLPGPAEWFAAASDVDLGVDLELAALRKAVSDLDALPPQTWLAVNLSPTALCSAELPTLIPGRHGRRIVLEMTEHDHVADYADLRAPMSRLRSIGVRFAADDAGSGYAGMRHLIEIRPDIIKMDYHLTHAIDADPARVAMAGALLTFAAATGATLLAEGIETSAELRTIVGLDIGLAQGYHLGRPVDLATTQRLTRPSPPSSVASPD